MAKFNWSNTAVVTNITALLSDVATSVVVSDATGYPASNFKVWIDNEVILVGSRTGTTFSSLTRGHDGTTGAQHENGAAVRHVTSAEDFQTQFIGFPIPSPLVGQDGYLLQYDHGNLEFDWVATSAVGVTDHGALTGRDDDDHSLYHTDGRALTWLGTRSTSDLAEGTNLYYTDGRADARAALQDHDHDSPIATHAAITSAHHVKYLDSEAVIAMGVKGDSNALHHDRYTDGEAAAKIAADDLYVKVAGDTMGGLFLAPYQFGGYSTPNNSFGGSFLQHPLLNNTFHQADKRYDVSFSGFSASNAGYLFNNQYDYAGTNAVAIDGTGIVTIDVTTGLDPETSTGITYTNGYVYVSFYYNSIPDSVTGRFQDKDLAWVNLTSPVNVSTVGAYAIWRLTVPVDNYATKYEITINAGSGTAAWLNEIEMYLSRPSGQGGSPVLDKYQPQTLVQPLTISDAVYPLTLVGDDTTLGILYKQDGTTSSGFVGHEASGSDNFYVTASNGLVYLRSLRSTAAAGGIYMQADDTSGTLRNRFTIFGGDDITFNKVDGTTVSLLWDESDDRWEFTATPVVGTTLVSLAGHAHTHASTTGRTSSDHHVRYADSEAVTAMGVKGDSNPLNHDIYLDADAVSAVGTPWVGLIAAEDHHARYTDTEAAAKIAADDLYVKVAGDTMGGHLTMDGNQIIATSAVTSNNTSLVVAALSGFVDSEILYLGTDDSTGTLRYRQKIDGLGDINFYKADGTTTSLLWDESDDRWEFADTPYDVSRTSLLAAETWVQSRGTNLVTNGFGMLEDNTNFNGFVYDATESFGGGGSFKITSGSTTQLANEYMPIDANRTYRLSYAAKGDSFGDTPAQRHYGMTIQYDADKLSISPQMVSWFDGTETTLAVALNDDDTTITLTSSTSWVDTYAGDHHYQSIIFFPYTNAKGFTYPDYTYSRELLLYAWTLNGITGNVITLQVPWAGGSYAAGTKVANCFSGGSYAYIAGSNELTTEDWTVYTGTQGGWNTPGSGGNSAAGFRQGTAYVKVGWLLNREAPANSISWIDGVTWNEEVIDAEFNSITPSTSDITFYKADGTTASLIWDESDDRWEFTSTPTVGTTLVALTTDLHTKYTDTEAAAKIAADDLYVKVAGDTMGGDLNMGGSDITGANDIVANTAQSLILRDDTVATRFRIYPNTTGDIDFYDADAGLILHYDDFAGAWEFGVPIDMGGQSVTNTYYVSSNDNDLHLSAFSSTASALDVYIKADNAAGTSRTRIFVDGDDEIEFKRDDNTVAFSIDGAATGDIIFKKANGTTTSLMWDESDDRWEFSTSLTAVSIDMEGATPWIGFDSTNARWQWVNSTGFLHLYDNNDKSRFEMRNVTDIAFLKADGTTTSLLWDESDVAWEFSSIVKFGTTLATDLNNSLLGVNEVQATDGGVTDPSFTFTNDVDTGIYRHTTDQLGITAAGVLNFRVTDGMLYGAAVAGTFGIKSKVAGTALLPTYTFNDDADTGMYLFGADQIGFAAGAKLRQAIGANDIAFYKADGSTVSLLWDESDDRWEFSTIVVVETANPQVHLKRTTTVSGDAVMRFYTGASLDGIVGLLSNTNDDMFIDSPTGAVNIRSLEPTGGQISLQVDNTISGLMNRLNISGLTGDINFYNNSAATTLTWDESVSKWEFKTSVDFESSLTGVDDVYMDSGDDMVFRSTAGLARLAMNNDVSTYENSDIRFFKADGSTESLLWDDSDGRWEFTDGITVKGTASGTRPILSDSVEGYGFLADNTGPGTAASRLWIDGDDRGAFYVGPRTGTETFHAIYLRGETLYGDVGGYGSRSAYYKEFFPQTYIDAGTAQATAHALTTTETKFNEQTIACDYASQPILVQVKVWMRAAVPAGGYLWVRSGVNGTAQGSNVPLQYESGALTQMCYTSYTSETTADASGNVKVSIHSKVSSGTSTGVSQVEYTIWRR